MEPVHKFLRLPVQDRRLVIEATLLLSAASVCLWLLPFRAVRRLLDRWASQRVALGSADRSSAERIAWSLAVASRYLPAATCLAQALAAQVLLGRYGYPACLRIGVVKSQEGRLEAHAWVECQARIVIGGSVDLARYIPLPAPEGTRL
jgi:hypothetical protein